MGFDGDEHRSVSDGNVTTVSIIDSDGFVILPGRGVADYVGPHTGPATQRRVFASVIAEDRDLADSVFRSVVDGTRSSAAMTLRLRRADGVTRLADLQLVDHRTDPLITGILLITRDITDEHARSETLAQLREAERFLGDNARRIAGAPSDDLSSIMDELVAEAGLVLGATRVTLSASPTATDDLFIDVYKWHVDGAEDFNREHDLNGFSSSLSRWIPSSHPKWIDMSRLERRWPELVKRTRHLGQHLLLYGIRLPNDGWGVLAVWDPAQASAAEFTITGLADLWSIVVARQTNQAQSREAHVRLESLLAHSSDLVVVYDDDLLLTYVSPGAVKLLGTAPDEAVGRSALDFLHPDDAMSVSSPFPAFEPEVASTPRVIRIAGADGQYRTFEAVISDLRNDPNVKGVVVNARDVTDVAQYKQELQRHRSLERLVRRISTTFATATVDMTEELLTSCLKELLVFTNASRAGIYVPDATGEVFFATYQVTGGDLAPIGDQIALLDLTTVTSSARSLKAGGVVLQHASQQDHGLISAIEVDGSEPIEGLLAVPLRFSDELLGIMMLTSIEPGWDCPNELLGLLRTIGEIGAGALMRQRVERNLAEGALRDPLTGLPNRRMLMERLSAALVRSAETSSSVALMFVDCDGFKEVNDSHGHEHGDRLLIQMAERLEAVCVHSASIARLGGDEFVVMIDENASERTVTGIAERIVDSLKEPFELTDRTVRVTVSVGVAFHSGRYPGIDAGSLLRRADLAMYQAKEAGRNRYQVFTDEMETTTRARFGLLSELREATRLKNQFEVWYQPVVDLRSTVPSRRGGRDGDLLIPDVVGFEALVRWRHPTRGLLHPAGFIDLAEESGVIEELGWQVFETAIDQLLQWRSTGQVSHRVSMAVNLSVRQLQSNHFVDRVRSFLTDCGLPPKQIVFEVTESVFGDRAYLHNRLLSLRDMGVKIAIDDFGTGYSSLAYLRDLPVDILKIDRSFTGKLGRGPRDNAMVAMVSHLADQMSIETVAEGVETPEQLAIVRELRCTYAQGFLLGRPVPARDLTFARLPPSAAMH